MGHRGKAKGAGRKAIWVISSRSLRSAQARKRVPGLASPSLGHYATLSFIVRGRGPENFGLGIGEMARQGEGDPNEIVSVEISWGREKRERQTA